MKKIFTSIAVIATVVTSAVILTSWDGHSGKMHTGAGGGYAGDPFYGHKNCTSCHSDYPAVNRANLITTNIPSTGWKPDSTYTITCTIASTRDTFGFECTAETPYGKRTGKLDTICNATTKLVNKINKTLHDTMWYVTHIDGSIYHTSKVASWSFTWTAPSSGSDTVVFWAAFNCANGDLATTGDTVVLDSLQLFQNLTGINEINNTGLQATVYPTVSNGDFTIQIANSEQSSTANQMEIYNVAGEKVYESKISNQKSQISLNVPNGCYFVWLRTENSSVCKKIIIVH